MALIDVIIEPEETKKNFVILQTDHISTKLCMKHDNIALQYLILEVVTLHGCAQKRKDKPCNHTESVNFQRQYNPSYFSAAYINANKSWPWSCFQCSINCGSDYKVNNKHPVMVCENAAKHDLVCMCAKCIRCYNKMQRNVAKPSQQTQRSRKD